MTEQDFFNLNIEEEEINYGKNQLPRDLPLHNAYQLEKKYNTVSIKEFLEFYGIEYNPIRVELVDGVKKYFTTGKKTHYRFKLSPPWVCIDIDTYLQNYNFMPFLENLPFTISTRKKRHFFCQLPDDFDLFDLIGKKSGVDIIKINLTDAEKEYNRKKGGKMTKEELGSGDILTEMWETLDAQVYLPSYSSKTSKTYKLQGEDDFQISQQEIINQLIPNLLISETHLKEKLKEVDDKTSNNPEEKRDCYEKCIDILKSSWSESFDTWMKICFCLPNDEKYRILFHEFSKASPEKYNEDAVNTYWDNCKERCDYGLQVLIKYCKIENPDLAKEMVEQFKRNKRCAEEILINNFNHKTCADYFYKENKSSFMYKKYWFELNQHNIWKEADDTPNILIEELYRYITKKLTEFNIYVAGNDFQPKKKGEKLEGKDLEQERNRLFKIVSNCKNSIGSLPFRLSVLKDLQTLYYKDDLLKLLNSKRHLFAFNNGVYDLETSSFRKIEPSDFISLTCGYDIPAKNLEKMKEAKGYFAEMFESEEDLLSALRCMACCLFGKNIYNKIFEFVGTGGNGKGCFFDCMRKIFGNYWGDIPMEYWFDTTKRDASRADIIAFNALYKRVLYSTETEVPNPEDKNNPKPSMAKFNSWSGGDVITCRDNFGKSKEVLQYEAYGCIIQNLNFLLEFPMKSKDTNALQRRVVIANFPYEFVDHPKNPQQKQANPFLKQKLQDDLEIRYAVLHLLLDIYETDIKGQKTLKLCNSTLDATSKFLTEEVDSIQEFMTSTYEKTDNKEDKINKFEVYTQFKESDNYNGKIKATEFYNTIKKLGFDVRGSNGVNYVFGVKLFSPKEETKHTGCPL